MIDREDTTCRDLYLDLLKKCLVNSIYEHAPAPIFIDGKTSQYSSERRSAGRDWPTKAHTMIGLHRLNNLHSLAQRVLEEGIEGDFLEAGVWRGGATIFMRGFLKAYAVKDKLVWVADSFCGFPPSDKIPLGVILLPSSAQWLTGLKRGILSGKRRWRHCGPGRHGKM